MDAGDPDGENGTGASEGRDDGIKEKQETTDQITLAAAMDDKTFAVFRMVAAADPLRPINVKMTYWKLFEIVKMLKEE